MELFVIRHAIAVDRSADLADEARPLTPAGVVKFKRVVRGMKRLGIELDMLRHSPWTRAVETADLLMPLVEGESVVDAGLARPPAADLLERLSGERVGIVGHEPWMGELVALLTQGSDAKSALDMRKGSVAWLEGTPEPGGMRLLALLPPKVLRRIG